MKILYMGTAAYDAIPAVFCKCDVCTRSRIAGGRNIRSRAQALIDGDLLLDFGPDTVAHLQKYGIDSCNINSCLITHDHEDHLYVDDMLIPQYNNNGSHVIGYYVGKRGYNKLDAAFDKLPIMRTRTVLNLIEPFKPFKAGEYTVLPLPANHDLSSSPVIYAIEKGGKRMLYGHDTGVFYPEVYEALGKFGKLDFVSLDCTGCNSEGWRNGHMCVGTDIEVIEQLKKAGLIDGKTVIVLNHFSHNGAGTYDDLKKLEKNNGFIISYDGMEVEF